MIECTENYIWYKKRRKNRLKRCFVFVLIICIVFSMFYYYKTAVCDQIIKISNDYTYTYCTESVNATVFNSLSNSVKYSDLITVEKNNSGDIVLMTVNSYKVNSIASEIVSGTTTRLKEKISKGIPIPILAFLGIGVLFGYGSIVYVETISVVDVKCEFVSDFKSVGINQTLHSVYVKVICEYVVEVPFNSDKNSCETMILISETVLVGKVPDIYLSNGIFK